MQRKDVAPAKLSTEQLHFDEHGYRYVYTESDGGHQWTNWRHYLSDFIEYLF